MVSRDRRTLSYIPGYIQLETVDECDTTTNRLPVLFTNPRRLQFKHDFALFLHFACVQPRSAATPPHCIHNLKCGSCEKKQAIQQAQNTSTSFLLWFHILSWLLHLLRRFPSSTKSLLYLLTPRRTCTVSSQIAFTTVIFSYDGRLYTLFCGI